MPEKYLPFGKPSFSSREIEAVARVLRTGWVGMGPETVAFEADLADHLGVPHVVTVNSCSSALYLSLLASDIKDGDEVICPSLTWCSTANAILHAGARPVFCDIDPNTLCMTPADVQAKLTPNTRAVIPVHFGGLAANIDGIRAVLPPEVSLVEDAAHALGARYATGKMVGASRNLCCFSFYANKNLSTGDGGAIALFDGALADRLRSLRHHALPIDAWKRFQNRNELILSNVLTELGHKMTYTDLQASIGRVQLARQDEFAAIRLKIASIYQQELERFAPAIGLQSGCSGSKHARHLFVVKLPSAQLSRSRDDIVRALHARNIGAAIHYTPLHTMPLYCEKTAPPTLPQTEDVAPSLITLPISASMTEDDAHDVVREFTAVLRTAVKTDQNEKPAPVYGFQQRLTADFPSQVVVDVTEVCNLACIHCPHPAFKASAHYSGRLLSQHLNTKLVDEVRQFGAGSTQYIRYSSSGEPLVHPRIYDMLEYAVENSGVFVTLTTNGTLLDEKRIAKLFSSGLHLIDVSLDAVTSETYSGIRVNGDLDVTRGNVIKLLEMKRRLNAPVSIVVSFVEQPANTHEADAFDRFWRDQGADRVVIRRLHSAANAVPDIADSLHSETENKERYPCLYPWERILLNSAGDLLFCPQDWVRGSTVASYSTTTIREAWQGEFYRRLREAHLGNDFSCHSFCGKCPDWKQTRWPGEGISYADLVQDCLIEAPAVSERRK